MHLSPPSFDGYLQARTSLEKLCFFLALRSHNDHTFSLSSSGKTVKKEPGNEESQQHFDDADKLLQEFQEAQVDRVGSRPSSNLSSLSNASERDQHHLGICSRSKIKAIRCSEESTANTF